MHLGKETPPLAANSMHDKATQEPESIGGPPFIEPIRGSHPKNVLVHKIAVVKNEIDHLPFRVRQAEEIVEVVRRINSEVSDQLFLGCEEFLRFA